MRELKFRAYFVKDNYMEYFDDLYWFEENMIHNNNDSSFIIIEQFIGIKDKNENDICEGDILESDNGVVGFIEYDPYNSCFDFIHRDMVNIHPCRCSVIGNIHENPELLT